MNVTDILYNPGSVVCRMPSSDDTEARFSLFTNPIDIISAQKPGDIIPSIHKMEKLLERGKILAGFFSYEASIGLDSSKKVHSVPTNFPLLWFGVYEKPTITFCNKDIPHMGKKHTIDTFENEISQSEYCRIADKIINYISAGDIYQANVTFRAQARCNCDPVSLFYSSLLYHPVPYAAFVNIDSHYIISNSPELFLDCNAGYIRSMPMKGTSKRDPVNEIDKKRKENLKYDEKNRAENVMIVDMVRNDLGRICTIGTIHVDSLFRVDTYPTVHQMISEVHGHLSANSSLENILQATYPPASITGAPKIRAMQIIAECERSPRKVYTGSIGCFTGVHDFCLNVAIRTLIHDKSETIELGIGSGIIADSNVETEWNECLLKSSFVSFMKSDFFVLETMLWDSYKKEIIYLEEHLARAKNTLEYFGWNTDMNNAIKELKQSTNSLQSMPYSRVRLLISAQGKAVVNVTQLHTPGWNVKNPRIRISKNIVDSNNVFLYHKTTHRTLYDTEYNNTLKDGFDEVVFVNENNYITEGAISNIFICKNNKWYTPAIHCGLLPGIWRKKCIEKLNAKEACLSIDDLLSADIVMIGNSVREGAYSNSITIQ